MAGGTPRHCRYFGFEQTWRLPQHQLPCLLAVIAVLGATTLPQTHGECAAAVSQCSCVRKYSRENVYCTDLGHITQVPPFRSSNTTYYQLQFNTTTLSTIQADAFRGVIFEVLLLRKIGIMTIRSGAFSGLENVLSHLDLSNNRIETIPIDAFSGLGQLKQLLLSDNRLKTVSPGLFRDLTHLIWLHLSRNQLETIPDDAFVGLNQSLEKLQLDNNRLKIINRPIFRHLSRLRELTIIRSQVETITSDAFIGLEQLRYLRLWHNSNMKTLTSALFSHLTGLEELILELDGIETISDSAFIGLAQLRKLDLWGNVLTTLNPAIYSHLTRLQELHLSENQIKTISEAAFDGLNSLTRVSIIKNPLVCDCRLAWLRRKADRLLDSTKTFCFNPPAVNGIHITEYDISMCPSVTITNTVPTTTDKPAKVDTPFSESIKVTSFIEESTSGSHVISTTESRASGITTHSGSRDDFAVTTISTITSPTQRSTTSGGSNNAVKSNTISKINIERILMIAFATLTAVLAVALVYTNRRQCAKCRTADSEADHYSHPRPEEIATTPAIYDTIAMK